MRKNRCRFHRVIRKNRILPDCGVRTRFRIPTLWPWLFTLGDLKTQWRRNSCKVWLAVFEIRCKVAFLWTWHAITSATFLCFPIDNCLQKSRFDCINVYPEIYAFKWISILTLRGLPSEYGISRCTSKRTLLSWYFPSYPQALTSHSPSQCTLCVHCKLSLSDSAHVLPLQMFAWFNVTSPPLLQYLHIECLISQCLHEVLKYGEHSDIVHSCKLYSRPVAHFPRVPVKYVLTSSMLW